ncbi:MAG TPA: cytidylate kinase-like family protein [Clostridiales bacterium]|nr:cytidylate kinase-like family protein [Clostridiales bacterium]
MKDQLIIALGRENGSGGHEVAIALAEKLGITLYDTKVLRGFIEKSGLALQSTPNEWDEKRIRFFSATREDKFNTSKEQVAATLTFQFLRTEAEAGHSFVIVGRAADAVLRDYPNMVSVFVHASEDYKVSRIVAQRQCTEKEAARDIKAVDKQRRKYHDFYAKTKWGQASSYDLTLNSSYLPKDRLADQIIYYAKLKVPEAF